MEHVLHAREQIYQHFMSISGLSALATTSHFQQSGFSICLDTNALSSAELWLAEIDSAGNKLCMPVQTNLACSTLPRLCSGWFCLSHR